MDLAFKQNNSGTELNAPSSPSMPQYPTVTIEKKTGDYEPGDEFTAVVKFRVKSVTQGKEYGNDPDHHRCTLEMVSMSKVKGKGKGLPQHGGY